MISHIVLMTPKPELSADDRRAFLASFERALKEIPTVRDTRIGRRVITGADYDSVTPGDIGQYFVSIDFDDLAGLHAYLEHPAHKELGWRFYQSLNSAQVYDYEVGTLDEVARG